MGFDATAPANPAKPLALERITNSYTVLIFLLAVMSLRSQTGE